MIKAMKRFFKEEDGIGTVEIVIIIAILVGLAIVFRQQIMAFVDQVFGKIFGNAGDAVNKPSPLPAKSIGS
ncbi:MAG: hypothetical protein N2645_02610 [Clostridia bacterium]|nr:hypothetical protein [Clostridia bacterium]